MIGTPNEGNEVLRDVTTFNEANCLRLIYDFGNEELVARCAVAAVFHAFLDTQGLQDLAADSDFLTHLNRQFEIPELVTYSVQYGLNGGGSSPLHPHEEGDCIVSLLSARGPNQQLAQVAEEHAALSHTNDPFPFIDPCVANPLTQAAAVVSNTKAVIAGSGGGSGHGAFAAAPAPDAPSVPVVVEFEDGVTAGNSKVHEVTVPNDMSAASFGVYAIAAEASPELSVQLKRPDLSVVDSDDDDVVSQASVGSTGALGLNAHTTTISNPDVGTWEITVSASSSPTGGVPYVVMVIPDSQVTLAAQTNEPSVAANDQVTLSASLFDGTSKIAASSLSAEVMKPDSSTIQLNLLDNGTAGDKQSGDLVYSATFSATSACGTYPIKLTGTGTSTAEGTVTRITSAVFQVHVAESTLGDPCNSDDDDDSLTDDDELNGKTSPKTSLGTLFADPFDSDTDDDGCTDGQELGDLQLAGGRRDPMNEWDYFNPSQDGTNRVDDILLVVQAYYIDEENPGYLEKTDRTFVGPNEWSLGEPNGLQRVDDILNVVKQYFHDCASS